MEDYKKIKEFEIAYNRDTNPRRKIYLEEVSIDGETKRFLSMVTFAPKCYTRHRYILTDELIDGILGFF